MNFARGEMNEGRREIERGRGEMESPLGDMNRRLGEMKRPLGEMNAPRCEMKRSIIARARFSLSTTRLFVRLFTQTGVQFQEGVVAMGQRDNNTTYRETFQKSRAGGSSPGFNSLKNENTNRIQKAADKAGKAQRKADRRK